ncbi:hypothetical protein EIN_052310 [Entamoeba invadens IP1]|uniref:hypothetical protein n=1 Tax=Entamoeba invadens IP1 TaxID=370355 RepID=UPI0002C3E051|nr:hypothetical protein EIN_052310 [Entamoeba invadens IP1]ELP93026.1 hypothetical protein EIN_052310 [Entamoeba invadens IP1]|eukprot:XP_004259797.1 hypothetical protein EIN_052310 [Entamoeba invadens IP1]
MDLISTGIDVIDRLEKIEKLTQDAKRIIEMSESVAARNVFTVDEVINYAEKISGSVAKQPFYPKMKNSYPYPQHVSCSDSFNPDLIENVGWNRLDTNNDLSEEEKSKIGTMVIEEDEQHILPESTDSEEIL